MQVFEAQRGRLALRREWLRPAQVSFNAWKAFGQSLLVLFSDSRLGAKIATYFSYPCWVRFMILGQTTRVSCSWNRYMIFIGIRFRTVPLPIAVHVQVHLG